MTRGLAPSRVITGGVVSTGGVIPFGAVIASKGPVVTAPFDKILPSKLTFVPTVIAALLRTFPAKTLFAPSVVAPTGTQDTLSAFAFPASFTIEPATVLSAPPNRRICRWYSVSKISIKNGSCTGVGVGISENSKIVDSRKV